MRQIILDARILSDKTKAHDYLRGKLELPDHYGENLDALYDCLTELEDVEIIINKEHDENSYLKRVLRVFRDANDEGLPLKIIENIDSLN